MIIDLSKLLATIIDWGITRIRVLYKKLLFMVTKYPL